MHMLTYSQFPCRHKKIDASSDVIVAKLFYEIVFCLYNDINPSYMHAVDNNHTNTTPCNLNALERQILYRR